MNQTTSDKRYRIASSVIIVLLLVVVAAMLLAPIWFSGLRLYVILGGGVLLALNLLFNLYFFRRNRVKVDRKRRIR